MKTKAEKRRKRKKLAKLTTSAKYPKIRIPVAKANQRHKTVKDYDRSDSKSLILKGFDEA